jgi:N-acetyltransferase 10
LAIAGALQLGYSNIFVTAPSPDNLKTLLDFVCIGLELLDFKERQDFERVYSSNK